MGEYCSIAFWILIIKVRESMCSPSDFSLYLYIESRFPILLYFIAKIQINQYIKCTNIYVNFIVLLCKLTIDFVGVWRYN